MKRLVRGLVLSIAALAALVVVAAVVANLVSLWRQQKRYTVEPVSLALPGDSASLARGRHLATAIGSCADCHAADFGGRVVIDSPVMGRFTATNLTPGRGGIAGLSNEDLATRIRHGVGPDGRSLRFMPSESFHAFSDDDLASLIAYLRQVPAVDRELPATRVGPLARVLHLVGFPLLAAERVDRGAAPAARTPSDGRALGAYLAATSGCTGCHGLDLAGTMLAPSLVRDSLGAWTEADFARAVRQGRRPNGTVLADDMPWKNFAGMTDDEVGALWLHLRSLPAAAR